jgi:hypothetical protein
MEELSEIIHRGRNDYLIIRTARQLKDRHSDEVTDDLGINSDDMATNSGLKYQSVIIILHHLKVGVEETNQSSLNKGATIMSKGATIMSERTTFRSAMTGRSMILVLRAALSPSVL